MELFVNANQKTSELIKKFNSMYPFLRLEIYYQGEEMGASSHNCLLKDIVNKKAINDFMILPEMKVSEVEEAFWENMGLQISIFRKSGKTWLESSFTNYWSLERQNNLGREMNNFMTLETKKAIV
jgi:hypothetical protein